MKIIKTHDICHSKRIIHSPARVYLDDAHVTRRADIKIIAMPRHAILKKCEMFVTTTCINNFEKINVCVHV